ncbi:MAG: stage III sporulation protein AB [Eubacterium sp.]|nr:stage III sporulation protein AB [Eubacterium sp.]
MKITGSLCILLVGFMLSQRLTLPMKEHVDILQEGHYLFGRIVAEIRAAGLPLPDLFARIATETKTSWNTFFREMYEELSIGTEQARQNLCIEPELEFTDLFEKLLKETMGDLLSQEEITLFLQIGRGLISEDMIFHRENMRQISSVLEPMIADARKRYRDRLRLSRVLCLSGSLLAIIILI